MGGRDERRHLHVHALMACGALQIEPDAQSFWRCRQRSERFLLPVHALSEVILSGARSR